MIKMLLITAAAVTLLSCSDNVQRKLPLNIEQETQNRIDVGYHLSTVIGIVDKDGARFYNFGQMSLSDNSKPNENSIFEIASITKPFTTTLLADLELSGQIKINSSIEQYMPVFKQVLAQSNRTITLEDLVNHTSGLPRNPSNTTTSDSNRYKDYSAHDLNEFLSHYTIKDPTRAYFYSSLAYIALERAIEIKMNSSFETLAKNRIFKTLDMKDTHFDVPDEKRIRLVRPFKKGKHVDEVDMGQFPAGGGLKTTAKDMVRFLEAQLGMYPSTLDEAIKSTHKERFSNEKETLGLAWSIMRRPESGKTIIYHKGGSEGFVSFAGFNSEDQIGVIVLASGTRYFSDLGFKLLDPTYPLTAVE